MSDYGFGTPKRHILARTASFDAAYFRVKVGAGVLAVGDWKNPPPNEKIAETKGCAKSRMRINETPHLICIKLSSVSILFTLD